MRKLAAWEQALKDEEHQGRQDGEYARKGHEKSRYSIITN
jgi:hypothetical protein